MADPLSRLPNVGFKHKPERLPVQGDFRRTAPATTIPAIIGEATWQGYAADGHGSQSCADVHSRGGYDAHEIVRWLSRAVDLGLVEIVLTDKARKDPP